ncbi:hypothetical protein DFP72DRAFT_1053341 [Ephemerocybe angulata]|uniref:Uncharacterized protein n=1 Tax=Ephemerocybe angulata TaxID=980116 RepID=A0A8H6HBQ4_9AGAR|nr:hypothetical protein DFP72DRAFT_1053341 [Tulosesus angulatus]
MQPQAPTLSSSQERNPEAKLKTGIQFLAFETLDQIAQYLFYTPADLTSFMLVCRYMALVAEDVRYKTIIIEGTVGRKQLSNLLSGSDPSKRCLLKILRIWYRGWTPNLQTLWLNIDNAGCAHLIECMKRSGLTRKAEHPAVVIRDISIGPFSFLTLPNLHYLRITGPFKIGSIGAYRHLSELEMQKPLNHEEFAEVISIAEGNTCLALPILSHAFPNIRNLAFDKASLVVKDVLQLVGATDPLFRHTRNLLLNRRYACRVPKRALAHQHGEYEGLTRLTMDSQLELVATRHQRLVRIGIGRNLFELDNSGTFQHALLDFSSETAIWDRIFGVQFSTSRFSGVPPRPGRRLISAHFRYVD